MTITSRTDTTVTHQLFAKKTADEIFGRLWLLDAGA